jgi:hypothetical protein
MINALWKTSVAAAIACGLIAIVPIVHASPSPRAVVEMGGISVVLVAADSKIHAYVDDIVSNAPIDDATLALELRNNDASLNLQQVSPGLFVAPFIPAGRDRLLVALSRAGTERSEAVAELVQQDASVALPIDGHAASGHSRLAWLMAGVVMLTALGAIVLGARRSPAIRSWRAAHPEVG